MTEREIETLQFLVNRILTRSPYYIIMEEVDDDFWQDVFNHGILQVGSVEILIFEILPNLFCFEAIPIINGVALSDAMGDIYRVIEGSLESYNSLRLGRLHGKAVLDYYNGNKNFYNEYVKYSIRMIDDENKCFEVKGSINSNS